MARRLTYAHAWPVLAEVALRQTNWRDGRSRQGRKLATADWLSSGRT
ncbi:hypothetical protein AB0O76_17795 [Streptomyces sp. NPDC086554]